MMYTKRVAPLTINTTTARSADAKPVFAAATFRYTEQSVAPASRRQSSLNRPGSRQTSRGQSSQGRQRNSSQTPSLSAYPGSTASPPGMYVRALYNYDADDQTSLSFRAGDVIQVITQLESGWWDGIINGVRGWFPSNYCVVVSDPFDHGNGEHSATLTEDASGESGTEDESGDDERRSDMGGNQINGHSGGQPTPEDEEQEEAAFWIPQATQDGRLFYFNTLTGVSTMDLPLETPTSANETGPRDRLNIRAPDQTRPPLEMMAGGYEFTEDEDSTSASEVEGDNVVSSSARARRRSYMSEGVSPSASVDSLNTSPMSRSQHNSGELRHPTLLSSSTTTANIIATSFTGNLLSTYGNPTSLRAFYDDGTSPPLTWNRLVENMRRSVEAYRLAINNADRSEYVSRAEDISDHLRMLLAAGSGTTDNHSGNPSIISTNKALYPHFRDMMSRFSKLVLSSHIAAADWPAADSYSKCLQEAEGVLQGVHGYVEVARAQRGEEIPRLVPGFILGSQTGGNWQNNNLGAQDALSSPILMDHDEFDPAMEPSAKLDADLLERMDDLKRMIVSSIRRLDEQLVVTEKLITPMRHEQLSTAICTAATKVVEYLRPYISTVESINLVPLGSLFHHPQLIDFAIHKQRLYDTIANLVLACQIVAGPLSDEWADIRGEPLENRVRDVQNITKQLETLVSQMGFSLQLLLENMPQEPVHPLTEPVSRDIHRRTDGGASYEPTQLRDIAKAPTRPQLGDVGQSHSYSEGVEPVSENHTNSNKIKQFFGEVPRSAIPPSRDSEEVPSFLRLDYEGEIAYDFNRNPPQLRGGTLPALVEQLTRHDRLDADFNNTFLLTYRSFTTADELFKLLVKRFSIQPPRGITQDQYQVWVDRKQKPIRIRVVNILKNWFDSYWMENNDEASNNLLQRVYNFAHSSIATTSTPGSGPLMTVVEQRLRGQDTSARKLILNLNTSTPQPIMPKNMKKLKFLDIDVTEFARQLTIIESRLYGKIKPAECLNKTWQKKLKPDEAEPAPNVKALILHSNQLTNWVAEMILTQSDVKKRVVVIKHFVSVADKCRALNNFSTLTSIMSALGTAPILRLSRTWAQVNARTSSVLETMRRLMGSTKNFAEYRETLHLANPPCIPFFGIYLTDLTFIEDGISSVLKRANLINFAKRAKTAEVIRDIQQYQNVPYPLQPVPELQDYILTNMQAASDVHEMYDKSLLVEPREREDEKIARYKNLSFQISMPKPLPPIASFATEGMVLEGACIGAMR